MRRDSPGASGGLDVTEEYVAALGVDKIRDLRDARDAVRRWAAARYREPNPGAQLVEFEHGSAEYVFDQAGDAAAERTVLVVGRAMPPPGARDASYQRGYPLSHRLAGRPVDRGHFMPHSGGGLFGPNIFVQDRALNRGWSAEGRAYRALEKRAIGSPQGLLCVRPLYVDQSDVPGFVDLALIEVVRGHLALEARRFRNRYDLPVLASEDEICILLQGATDAQLGALGEECAAALLEDVLDATIVTMGDAGMPREEGRQSLDLVVIVDGSLAAVEVKTRYRGKLAGRRNRLGTLPAPRMNRGRRAGAPAQGSQEYVGKRSSRLVETDAHDYAGVDVLAVVVDLRTMYAEVFEVSDDGKRTTARAAPIECRNFAREAWTLVREHRGHLLGDELVCPEQAD